MGDYIKVFIIEVLYGVFMMWFGIRAYKSIKNIKKKKNKYGGK